MMQNYSLDTKLKLTKEELLQIDMILKKESKRTTVEERTINAHKENYTENAHSVPVYKQGYFRIEAQSCEIDQSIRTSQTAKALDTYWDATKFDSIHAPVSIGKVENKALFQQLGQPRCSHLPVKFAGSNDFKIPNEYSNFKEVLTKIISTETTLNPNLNEYYAYLTVDQRFVPKGNSQRIKGAHVDGIPRNREHPSTQLIDHSYLVCDSLPTKFYPQSYPQMKKCDLLKHNFFSVFDHFKDESSSFVVEPFLIYLMNAYSVHSATNSETDLIRTFLRLEFSTLKFDREGNSKNPYFNYDWSPRQCHTPKHLVFPDFLL